MAGLLKSRGFTLMEAILSITLIGIIFVLALNLYPASVLTIRQSEQKLRADTVARSLLESYASQPFSELVVGSSVSLTAQEWNGVTYQPVLRILNPPEGNAEYVKDVEIQVHWQVRKVPRSVTHRLAIARVRR